MRDLGTLHLRVCFTLFMSAQFSNAGKIAIPNPELTLATSVTIDSLSVKEPGQEGFTRQLLAKQMLLGIHRDGITFSFYEKDAPYTYFTFTQKNIDFETFHSKSMSFTVVERSETFQFRVVFSADKNTLDTLYPLLSIYTGHGVMTFKMNIMKVETYVRIDRTRNPIIQAVVDLDPAMLFEQKIESGPNPSRKIFKITPYSPVYIQRKLPRLVFRTGNFKAGRVNEKVVLELAGSSHCLYIIHFPHSHRAETFLDYTSVRGTNDHVALRVAPDVRSYLETGTPRPYTQTESEPQSSVGSDGDDPRTLPLADWS